jgi:hypothetical protein
MDTHGPIKPGELIGFMVTSGNARDSVGPYGPMERSNVVVVPAADVATYTFNAQPPPPIVQPPPVIVQPPLVVVPPPPVVVAPPPVAVPLDLAAAVRAVLNEELLPLERDTNTKTTEVRAEVKSFGQQFASVMAFVGKYIAPAVTAWIAAHQLSKP